MANVITYKINFIYTHIQLVYDDILIISVLLLVLLTMYNIIRALCFFKGINSLNIFGGILVFMSKCL